jgi:hypothetical protein
MLYRFYLIIKCPKKQNQRIQVHEQVRNHSIINVPWNWKVIFPMTILIRDYFNKNKALKYKVQKQFSMHSTLLITVVVGFIAFAVFYPLALRLIVWTSCRAWMCLCCPVQAEDL